jgi:hypothetical protein
MSSRIRLFRRIAVVVAALQLVAVAGASVLEAATVANQKVAAYAVDSAQSHGGAIHDPGTCPACQLLTAHARRSEATSFVLPPADVGSRSQQTEVTVARGEPRRGFASRAPPFDLA